MSRSRCKFPSLQSVLALAAKLGLAVRIDLGPNGKVASIQTIGKADSAAPNGAADANPWDQVHENGANKKRPS